MLCGGWWAHRYCARGYPNVLLVHHWAHVRREVIACEKSFPKEAGDLLGMIANMYVF